MFKVDRGQVYIGSNHIGSYAYFLDIIGEVVLDVRPCKYSVIKETPIVEITSEEGKQLNLPREFFIEWFKLNAKTLIPQAKECSLKEATEGFNKLIYDYIIFAEGTALKFESCYYYRTARSAGVKLSYARWIRSQFKEDESQLFMELLIFSSKEKLPIKPMLTFFKENIGKMDAAEIAKQILIQNGVFFKSASRDKNAAYDILESMYFLSVTPILCSAYGLSKNKTSKHFATPGMAYVPEKFPYSLLNAIAMNAINKSTSGSYIEKTTYNLVRNFMNRSDMSSKFGRIMSSQLSKDCVRQVAIGAHKIVTRSYRYKYYGDNSIEDIDKAMTDFSNIKLTSALEERGRKQEKELEQMLGFNLRNIIMGNIK